MSACNEFCAFSLKAAVEESEKLANVDLAFMVFKCGKCSEHISKLQTLDTDAIRLNALAQVKCVLEEQEKTLSAKMGRLNGRRNDVGSRDSSNSQPNSETAINKVSEACDEPLKKSRKMAIQETITDKGSVTFDDVAGLEEAKQTLREAIVMPLQFPHLFTGFRKPWKRILLYGPPGTGKTRLAQAISSAIESTFYCVSSSNLISSWLGESEKLIKELFENAQAKEGRSVIFIDEIDSLCRKRISAEQEHTRRVKTEFLKQMEGADSSDRSDKIFLLCATNCPWELDPAFLRRFQKRIFIPLPNRDARLSLMKIHTKDNEVKLTENDWKDLADKTEGYSGSDIATFVLGALMEPIRHMQKAPYWRYKPDGTLIPCKNSVSGAFRAQLLDLPPDQVRPRDVILADFLYSLSIHGKTVSNDDLQQFTMFTGHFGQSG